MASNLRDMIICSDCSIRDAMVLIGRNAKGIVFVVDHLNKLCGVMTDGDIRRGLLGNINMDDNLIAAMNREYVAFQKGTPLEKIIEKIGYKYKCIPIVDSNDEVFDYFVLNFRSRIPIAQPCLSGNELKYVTECIATNWISSQGKYVERFENQFAEYIGAKYAVTTSNGTSALHLALETLHVKNNDEVIVPTLTFVATANAVSYTGAKPVFVDSEMDTWNLSPDDIKKKITNKTKAIIPVHLYGQPAKMDEIMEISRENNLFVIEDAAEAHGAEYKGKKVGTIGDIGIFSFFGNKIITTGEGGMIVTDNYDFYERARMLRDHGMSREKRYWHSEIGFNYRMTNIQAAVGCAQLEKVDMIIASKFQLHNWYAKRLSSSDKLILPPCNKWSKHVCWLFSVLMDKNSTGITRNEVLIRLEESGIGGRPFFFPVHTLPPYSTGQSLERAEYLSQRGLSLPSYVGITENNVNYICDTILEITG